MSHITSIKELQATCDELYNYFVERLAQVTEVEGVDGEFSGINGESSKDIYLHIVKNGYYDNCLTITKWHNGDIWLWADGNNGLMVGVHSDPNAIEIVRTTETINDIGSRVLEEKRYTNKNGHKIADQKKRAILLDLKAKLEVLFKDYL